MGALTASLTITGVNTANAGNYDVVVTSACRSEVSASAALTLCLVDFNCDGTINPDDLGDFINCYFLSPPCAGGGLQW